MSLSPPATARPSVLGWSALAAGVLALALSGLPRPVAVLPLAAAAVVLSVIALARGHAAHGLAGMVTALIGAAVSVALLVNLGAAVGLTGTHAEAGGGHGGGAAVAGQDPVQLLPSYVNASAAAPAFAAANLADGSEATAWRVPGSGVGSTLAFAFGGPVHLSAIGIAAGSTQDRRVTEMLCAFADGSSAVASYSDIRGLQAVGVDVDTTTVSLTITESSINAARDFTAISEVVFVGWPSS
jgi:hypothetical protein